MRTFVLFLVIGLSWLNTIARAEDPRLDLALPKHRWQAFAPDVPRVYVAPNNKLYCECAGGRFAMAMSGLTKEQRSEKMLAQIAAEFDRDMPQIWRANIVLFEPKGRVWFSSSSTRQLVGYDGKDWIKLPLDEKGNSIIGRPLSRGTLIDADANRYINGVCWFLGPRGVHTFDGESWSYVQMVDDAPVTYDNRLRMAVSADGKLAVVHPNRSQDMWVFHAGKWNKRTCFTQGPDLNHLAISNAGDVWVVKNLTQATQFKINDTGELVEQPLAPDNAMTFGDVQAGRIASIFQDEQGRTFVAGQVLSQGGAKPVAGLLVLDATGKTRIIAGQMLPSALRRMSLTGAAPIFSPSGKQLWLPNEAQGKPPTLLDLDSGAMVDSVPGATQFVLRAVTDEGRVFVAPLSSYSLMVYSPGEPESKQVEPLRQDIRARTPVEVGDDGSIWALDPQSNLIHWNGSAWSKLKKLGEPAPNTFLAGDGGLMLVERGDSLMLFQGEKEIAQDRPARLLEEHHELLARGYGSTRPPALKDERFSLAADSAGNLWCQHNGNVRVLVGSRWHETIDSLLAAGSRDGIIRYLAPMSDGRRVYLCDLQPRLTNVPSGVALYGEVKDGKLVFENGPYFLYQRPAPLMLRDRENAIWFRTQWLTRAGNVEYPAGQLALRVKADGVAEEYKDMGYPQLVDQAGIVWLGEIQNGSAIEFNLWRSGKIVNKVRVPGFDRNKSFLFANAPGSVFAVTHAGLLHLVADAPDYTQYRLGEQYSLSKVTDSLQQTLVTRRGELVVVTSSLGTGPETYTLWIIKPPGKS